MKRLLYICLFMILLCIVVGCSKNTNVIPNSNVTQDDKNDVITAQYEKSYIGTINNNLSIHMKLKFEGSEVSGTYYYDKYKVGLQLKGIMDNQNNIEMKEYDLKGILTGIFKGEITPTHEIQGSWLSPNGEKVMTFLVKENIVDKSEFIQNGNENSWAGEWSRLGKDAEANYFCSANITISKVNLKSFYFDIMAFNGGNSGGLDGTAKINGNVATFTDDDGKYKVLFTYKDDTLKVQSFGDRDRYMGMGVEIDGDYKKGIREDTLPTLKELGVFQNDIQELEFKKLVGTDYENFVSSFQYVTNEIEEENLGATVCKGFVRGIGDNAIIVYTSDGKLWAAVLDDNINYYTNTSNKVSPPETIVQWSKEFSALKIVNMNK